MPRVLRMKVMFVEEQSESSESDVESLSAVMSEFKDQMQQIEQATKKIDSQVTGLFTRAKKEGVDWLHEPLSPTPKLQAWLKGRPNPTIEEFLDLCFDAATSMDLETRVLTFNKADAAALWGGQRRLTIFDMVAMIPALFV